MTDFWVSPKKQEGLDKKLAEKKVLNVLKKRFLKRKKIICRGFSNFADYETLELTLVCVLPGKDVKVLAKEMVSKFGSLKQVFDADKDELKGIKGISEW